MLHVYLECRLLGSLCKVFGPLFPSCFITKTSDSAPLHNSSLHFSLEHKLLLEGLLPSSSVSCFHKLYLI